MGMGKERRTLIGPRSTAKATPVAGTTLRTTGPTPLPSGNITRLNATRVFVLINNVLTKIPLDWVDAQNHRGLDACGFFLKNVCLYVWSSHIAEYGSTG